MHCGCSALSHTECVKDESTTKIFLKERASSKTRGFLQSNFIHLQINHQKHSFLNFNRLQGKESNKKLKMQSSYQETGRRRLKAGEEQFNLS